MARKDGKLTFEGYPTIGEIAKSKGMGIKPLYGKPLEARWHWDEKSMRDQAVAIKIGDEETIVDKQDLLYFIRAI